MGRSRSARSSCAGIADEARAFFDWMLRAIGGDPAQMQIMYGIRGERRLSEVELNWLGGYEGARAGSHRKRRLRPAPARRLRRESR